MLYTDCQDRKTAAMLWTPLLFRQKTSSKLIA